MIFLVNKPKTNHQSFTSDFTAGFEREILSQYLGALTSLLPRFDVKNFRVNTNYELHEYILEFLVVLINKKA